MSDNHQFILLPWVQVCFFFNSCPWATKLPCDLNWPLWTSIDLLSKSHIWVYTAALPLSSESGVYETRLEEVQEAQINYVRSWFEIWRTPLKMETPLKKKTKKKKQGTEQLYNPAIPLLGIHPKETGIERDTCVPMFIAALYTIARTWK